LSGLGDRLRTYRKRAGLSIYDVENLTGRHFTTISKYERGERRPDIDTLKELASAYEVSPGRLISAIEDINNGMSEEMVCTVDLLKRRPDILKLLPDLEKMDPEEIKALRNFLAVCYK